MSHTNVAGTRKGFTLVELAVVIVIIGVLAAFGVPRFLQSVERTKASEAFAFLSAVRGAQERYVAQQGFYATALKNLDINQSTLKYFKAKDGTTAVTGDTAIHTTKFDPAATTGSEDKDNAGKPTWILTLTRDLTTSSYGAYTVVFTQDGFDTSSSILGTATKDISPLPSTSAYSSGQTDAGGDSGSGSGTS
jgi:prepilin-type N-terminal cleavage/methylation domain-containing protein